MNFLYDNFIAEFLFAALKWVFSWAGQHWLAIILVTLAIKLVLLPLDIKQRASSAKMQMASGEVENIKKRYANNPDQAQKKIKEYYKKNNISATAGCLPMLLSMVLLFAFYGALRNIVAEQTISLVLQGATNGAASVELPKFLWVHNVFQADAGHVAIMPTADDFLSFLKVNSSSISPQMLMMMKEQGILIFENGVMTVDTAAYKALTDGIVAANGFEGLNNGWYGLPLIAGGTLFLQQWLTSKNQPANAQPGGKMMLYFFPVFSAYICMTSNACFALYWTFSNVCAMAVHLGYNAYLKNKKKKEPVTIDSIR